jgi:hypothetical protein
VQGFLSGRQPHLGVPDNLEPLAPALPRVGDLPPISVGPGGAITARPLAPGRILYRETNVSGVEDILLANTRTEVSTIHVTDNPDLALGQGDNRGVQIIFRPDSLSGSVRVKPGISDITGQEYVTDIVAPRAVQQITLRATDIKSLRKLARLQLSREFTRTDLGDGRVRFVRNGFAPVEQSSIVTESTTTSKQPKPKRAPKQAAQSEQRRFDISRLTDAEVEEYARLDGLDPNTLTKQQSDRLGELYAKGVVTGQPTTSRQEPAPAHASEPAPAPVAEPTATVTTPEQRAVAE